MAMNARTKMSTRGVNSPISGLPKSSAKSLSVIVTGSSSEMTKAMPRRKKSIPSVAMNELMPTTTTKKAFTAPMTRPMASATAIPTKTLSKLAITTPETAKMLAMLRSSSPIRITAVKPTAVRPIRARRPSVTS